MSGALLHMHENLSLSLSLSLSVWLEARCAGLINVSMKIKTRVSGDRVEQCDCIKCEKGFVKMYLFLFYLLFFLHYYYYF